MPLIAIDNERRLTTSTSTTNRFLSPCECFWKQKKINVEKDFFFMKATRPNQLDWILWRYESAFFSKLAKSEVTVDHASTKKKSETQIIGILFFDLLTDKRWLFFFLGFWLRLIYVEVNICILALVALVVVIFC